jgi:light-regulated signal transduction histidine kinase (bacteriophytochrome)
LTAGADDYLVKPFGARELVARVDGAIRLARARQEAARRERDVISKANIALSREVEERKQAESRLKKYMTELRRSNQELDEFAYIASHDLKEPLRGIHNYASFLQEDYSGMLDDEARNYLERIQRLTERLSALIDRILAYSRLGRSEFATEMVDVDAVLDRVAEDLKSLLDDHGVELRRSGPLPSARGDPVRIGEVFQNLIANAVKYNDKPEKWVEVGCGANGSPPVFHVRDNGIGVPPKHQESVFRMFKRLHEQDKYGGGTGAGLAIVKKIVERHGGKIWLESVPGEGSTFYFTFAGVS